MKQLTAPLLPSPGTKNNEANRLMNTRLWLMPPKSHSSGTHWIGKIYLNPIRHRFVQGSVEIRLGAFSGELAPGHLNLQSQQLSVFLAALGQLFFKIQNPLFVGAQPVLHRRL